MYEVNNDPSSMQPEIHFRRGEATVEIYNVRQMTENPHGETLEIYSDQESEMYMEGVNYVTMLARPTRLQGQRDTGEPIVELKTIIQFDDTESAPRLIRDVQHDLSYYPDQYTVYETPFSNVIDITTEDGMRLLTWFDYSQKRVVISNALELEDADLSVAKKASVFPTSLNSLPDRSQLSSFVQFSITAFATIPGGDEMLIYRIGEKNTLIGAPVREVGRISLAGAEVIRWEQPESEVEDVQVEQAESPDNMLEEESRITLADVACSPEIYREARLMITSLQHPEKYQSWGATPGRGLLLYGPPGNGKTMLAEAIANEVGELRRVAPDNVYSKWIGEPEKNIRAIFTQARESSTPVVLLFDELEKIIKTSGKSNVHSLHDSAAAVFQAEMDSLPPHVAVIATTNYPDAVDESIRRRLDRKLYIPLPDESVRLELFSNAIFRLEQQVRRFRLPLFGDDIKLPELVHATESMSAATIVEIFNRVTREKAFEEIESGVRPASISQADLLRIIMGLRREGAQED